MQRLLEDCRDLLSNWLDDLRGSSITDKAIFADLARYYEADYHDDMQALNVSAGDVTARPITTTTCGRSTYM